MATISIRSAAPVMIFAITAILIACGSNGDAPATSGLPVARQDVIVVTPTSTPATRTSPLTVQDVVVVTPTPAPVSSGGVRLNPDRGGPHIAPGQTGTNYSERPATSGQHWFAPDTPAGVPAPARWGIYDFPLPDEVLVHNLEHGGVGIHYDCPDGCDQLISQLKNLIPRNPSQHIMSPYPGMETKIAITAWRRHVHLDEFDEARIREFIASFRNRAPESVPGNTF